MIEQVDNIPSSVEALNMLSKPNEYLSIVYVSDTVESVVSLTKKFEK